jgi:peptidoglycan hydrolase-like protein with peptidoglycan-binding domain
MNTLRGGSMTSLEPVRLRGTTPLLAGLALLLAACSTTSMASQPLRDDPSAAAAPDTSEAAASESTPVATTQPPVTEPPTTAVRATEPATTPPATEPATTAPPDTAPPDTAPPETAPPETAPPETAPPVPANVVPVPAMTEPLGAVGTRSGAETVRAQWRLLELGFWLSGADGDYGLTTRQAVMAFQKYYNLPASGSIDADTAAWMSAVTERPRGRADAGTLVEIDKGKQLLYFVRDGRTEWILNTSTGNGLEYEEPDQNTPGETIKGVALTPSGLHKVNRERVEGWWEGDLGEIYRPKYFVGGIAVHGSNSVPNYPASHGCVRVTVPAMDWIWANDLMPMGTPVWVHDGV